MSHGELEGIERGEGRGGEGRPERDREGQKYVMYQSNIGSV
jgi:hypothetical protein